MEYFIRIVAIIGMFSISTLAFSSEITDTYTTGDTLTTTTLDNIKDAVNDNDARATTLETGVTTLDARATTLETGVTTLDTRATTLEARATTLDARATTLETGVTTLDARATTLETGVTSLDTRVTTLEVAPEATIAIIAPTVNDDINAGFEVGSVWVDTLEGVAYILTDNAPGIAVWKPLTTKSEVYTIGDVGPAGGWVFFVDADGRHGLEAATADQSAAIPWSSVLTNIEARGNGVGGGVMNTLLIVANLGFDSNLYAAGLCANLNITNAAGVVYSDWYMPSEFELNLMYLNIGQGNATLGNVGVFADISYWSSSESSLVPLDQARFIDFGNNGAASANIKTGTRGVRAIRAF